MKQRVSRRETKSFKHLKLLETTGDGSRGPHEWSEMTARFNQLDHNNVSINLFS